jgi:hypothetical protein
MTELCGNILLLNVLQDESAPKKKDKKEKKEKKKKHLKE